MAKILIVDDSETLRTQLRRDLERAGYVVVEANDGLQGLDKLAQNTDVNLILCDVNMPVMDGLTMFERMFLVEAYRNIPKVMLTTEVVPAMKKRAKEAGVIAWIVKPYFTEKLLSAIVKLLK